VNDRDLAGKVVVVTGGSRGIGRALVLAAAARGAQVAFCARDIGRDARAVLEEAEQSEGAGRVVAIRADVAQEADVEALFDATLNTFGKVDVAINNAAISHASLLVSLTVHDWDMIIATNLTGSFLIARRAIKEFLARGEGGRIVSVGSLMQTGAPSNASYAASKGGLVGLTRAIAEEYGCESIFANLVVTGYVDTALTSSLSDSVKRRIVEASPQRRKASTDEIAAVVLFLASSRALCVNGQSIHATGGLMEVPL
jgi:NAD(P)-dependent dehydrogenase (short-subunit alcohol dehydrogenase family)